MKRPRSVLFVCLGNICRSPMAEGAFRKAVAGGGGASFLTIDSAGTANWHAGKAPDPRAVEAAKRHGVDLSDLRARPVSAADFYSFDLILGMDADNLAALRATKPADSPAEIALFLSYAIGRDEPVPDPYFGHEAGFAAAFSLIDGAAKSLRTRIIER